MYYFSYPRFHTYIQTTQACGQSWGVKHVDHLIFMFSDVGAE